MSFTIDTKMCLETKLIIYFYLVSKVRVQVKMNAKILNVDF